MRGSDEWNYLTELPAGTVIATDNISLVTAYGLKSVVKGFRGEEEILKKQKGFGVSNLTGKAWVQVSRSDRIAIKPVATRCLQKLIRGYLDGAGIAVDGELHFTPKALRKLGIDVGGTYSNYRYNLRYHYTQEIYERGNYQQNAAEGIRAFSENAGRGKGTEKTGLR